MAVKPSGVILFNGNYLLPREAMLENRARMPPIIAGAIVINEPIFSVLFAFSE